MAKGLSAAKAKKILTDGYIKGKPLTAKQRKSFTSGGIFQVYSEKGQSAAIENLCKEI